MAVGLFLTSNYTNPIPLPSLSPSLWAHNHPKHASFKPPRASPTSPAAVRFLPTPGELRRRRGASVVTRASPSLNAYLFAFLLPFSLIVGTVIAALRVGNKLDEMYLEELRLSEALRDEDDDDDDDDDGDEGDKDRGVEIVFPVEKPEKSPVRNRPKREI